MRLLHKDIDKHGAGHVVLLPEESEDMWHAYNLVMAGDRLKSTTIRKVATESSTGSTSATKLRTVLTLEIKAVDFDTQACMLRVKGRNVELNQHVKLGAYHTINLELNRKFTLYKAGWDSVALERIEQACNITQNSDLAAVVMQEGLANLCLITASMTIVRAKIDVTIPRKRKGQCAQHDKAMTRFYDQIIQAIQQHINFEVVKCVILASPGFVRDQFHDYMFQQAIKLELKVILENKFKFLLVHSSSGFMHSLKEVFQDPSMTSRLQDTKASSEIKALSDFYSMMKNDPQRAFYGVKQVEVAFDLGAIETLLVTDALFRAQDLRTRLRYVRLVDGVKSNGGNVRIFSSMHVSGEQLSQLSGIAAILRFPMDDPELTEEEEDNADENRNGENDFSDDSEGAK